MSIGAVHNPIFSPILTLHFLLYFLHNGSYIFENIDRIEASMGRRKFQ